MGVLVTAHLPLVRNQECAIFWSLKLTQINTTPNQVSILGNVISILAISFGERMQNKANCFIHGLINDVHLHKFIYSKITTLFYLKMTTY